jgi:hypothetical protein
VMGQAFIQIRQSFPATSQALKVAGVASNCSVECTISRARWRLAHVQNNNKFCYITNRNGATQASCTGAGMLTDRVSLEDGRSNTVPGKPGMPCAAGQRHVTLQQKTISVDPRITANAQFCCRTNARSCRRTKCPAVRSLIWTRPFKAGSAGYTTNAQ